jgi:hypothetical protein
MKKIFFVFSLALLGFISGPASAQQISIGVKGGYNHATWQGDAVESLNSLVSLTNGYGNTTAWAGFHVGGYVRIPVSPVFSIEPGAYYSQKGMQLTGEFSSEQLDFLNLKATITDKADYIDVPLLAKVFVAEGLHFYAGPQVSFLVSNKVNTRASVIGFNVLNRDLDYDSPFRKTDVGVVGGVGYRFTNGLNLNAGYDYGLNTVDKNGNFDTFNHVVKISAGFEF